MNDRYITVSIVIICITHINEMKNSDIIAYMHMNHNVVRCGLEDT